MKTLLITGTSGFVGRNLMRILENDYPNTFNIILLNDKNNEKYKTILYDNIFHFDVNKLLDVTSIDTLIILGGGVPQTNEQKDDVEFNFKTFDSTFFLLNNLPFKPRKIIFCSSVDVYGNSGYSYKYDPLSYDIIDERTPTRPNDKYGLFKVLSELFIKEYCTKNDIAYEILRFGPIFGIGDLRTNFLIPKWINNAKEGKDLILFGHPNMKRNLIFVDDVCRFVINAINCIDNETINIVSINNPSLEDIGRIIVDEIKNKKIRLIKQETEYFYGRDRIFDASKRCLLLGKEKFTLREAISAILKA